jgi:hypothetical protein
MMTKRFPARIEEFLWHIGARMDVTFDAVARLAAEYFGSAAPTVDEIATFICEAYRGKVNLNRMHRDTAVARWLRVNKRGRTVRELRRAAVERFGEARVPSASRIHAYLSTLPGRSLTKRQNWADRNPEVADWVSAHRAECTIDALRAGCLAAFGASRTPSRSALGRRVAFL